MDKRDIDLRLVDIEGTLCVVITGISVDEIERNPEVEQRIREILIRLRQGIKEQGWELNRPDGVSRKDWEMWKFIQGMG